MGQTTDYLSFFLNFPNYPPISVLTLFFLGLMRVAPIVSILPFLGAKLPGGVKIALALSLTAIFLPTLLMTSSKALTFNGEFLACAIKEFFVGFLLAFLAGLPFYIAQSAGIYIDFLRGSSALQVGDPTMQNQASPIGLLYNYVLVVLFYQINGPFIFFDAIIQSYHIVPADGFFNTAFFTLEKPFWQLMLGLLTKFTAISIQLAAPSIVAILMAEMFLGIANRLAPQVQIAFLGMSIKSLLGIALLFAGWFFILQQIAKQTLLWLKEIDTLLQSISF